MRLYQQPAIRGTILKDFQLALVSADPRAYTMTQYQRDSGPLVNGTVEIAVPNDGSIPTPPRLYVYGPITNPAITNLTTGETLTFAYTVAAGQFIDIDTKSPTAYRNDGVNLIDKLNAATNSFFLLGPGWTTLRLTGSGGDGSEKLRAESRDASVG